ncbi:MAG: tetratricopeptide repeat protein [Myxococcaceae bacterium]
MDARAIFIGVVALGLCAAPALAGPKKRPGAKKGAPAAPALEEDKKAAADFMAQMGKVSEAIALYDELLQERPGEVELIEAFIPICLKDPGCVPRVLELRRELVRLAPDDKDAVEDLFEALLKQGPVEDATKVLSAYLKGHPDDQAMRLELIQTLVGASLLERALGEIDAMPALHRDARVLLMRIDLLEQLRRLPALDRELAALLQRYPDSPGGWVRAGERAMDRDDLKGGQAALVRAKAKPLEDPADAARVAELEAQIAAGLGDRRLDYADFRVEIELADSEDDLEQRNDY